MHTEYFTLPGYFHTGSAAGCIVAPPNLPFLCHDGFFTVNIDPLFCMLGVDPRQLFLSFS